jgi:hypothetical protein
VKDPIYEILRNADGAATAPSVPHALADRVLARRRRRRATRMTFSLALMAALVLAIATMLFLTSSQPSRQLAATKRVSPGLPVERALATGSALDPLARVSELAAQRLVGLERANEQAAEARRRISRPDARLAMDHQRARAAMTLLRQAQRMRTPSDTTQAADARYRLVIELFPDTPAATIAQRRLNQSDATNRS